MRELFLSNSDSTETSLVLRTEDGEEFFLAVNDDLRAALEVETAPEFTANTGEKSDQPADAQPEKAATPEPAPATLSSAPRPYSDKMSMRPAEIQNRVRAGASAADLAAEMGVAESRVEPFAYPVVLERNRIAELAKQAHPIREDGPAKLTLWEVLASSFAARGHSVADASWDARRPEGEPWIIIVRWSAGLSENEAEWKLNQSMTSPATVEARNSVAADLIDPNFVQPVRSLTSIGTVADAAELNDEEDDSEEITRDDIPVVQSGDEEEDFLQNPDAEPKPKKRRRKAVTPHWEDVLLGVRANTKRPKN